LGPTQPPIQRLPGALSPGVKCPGREADHSPQSRAKVKNGGATPPLLHTSSWRGAFLIKHRDNFTCFLAACFQIFSNSITLPFDGTQSRYNPQKHLRQYIPEDRFLNGTD
jgi:hypothetical protein